MLCYRFCVSDIDFQFGNVYHLYITHWILYCMYLVLFDGILLIIEFRAH